MCVIISSVQKFCFQQLIDHWGVCVMAAEFSSLCVRGKRTGARVSCYEWDELEANTVL